MDLHDIARQVAGTAGADFAFVLSQAGLLVTRDAPRDMPDRGRMKILWACPKGKNGEVVHLELPRDELVPYGGAAPVDVFAVRVEDTAILVAVCATWNDKSNVVLALTAGAESLGAMIRKAKGARAQKTGIKKAVAAPAPVRRERASVAPAPAGRASTGRRERASVPPPASGNRERVGITMPSPGKRDRTSPAPRSAKEASAPAKNASRAAARSSEPEITVGEANVGRETLLALEAFRPPSSSEPEIVLGEAPVGRETMIAIQALRPRGRSEPEIVLGEAPVGRETLIAIDAELPRAKAGPAPDAVRVQLDSISRESMLEVERVERTQRGKPTVDEPLVTERQTLPWVDSPAALKRTMEARAAARAVAPPEVKLGVEEIDPAALESALREGKKR